MSAFNEASKIEKRALLDLVPYANKNCVQVVMTQEQRFLQKVYGDMIAEMQADKFRTVEIKAELKRTTGNLFIEEWSNRSRRTPGWITTCNADVLWYYFVEDKELYTVDLPVLRRWGIGQRRMLDFPLKAQAKYEQLNDTWGWCVPITVLQKEVPTFQGPIDPTKETTSA